MKTFLTIVLTAIVVVVVFVATATYRPEWLIKLEYDKNGFPRIRREGDYFILKNITYWFHNGVWVQLDSNGFPIIPAPKINDIYIKNNISYTYTASGWVLTPAGPGNNSSQRSSEPIFLYNRDGFPVDFTGAIIGLRVKCKEGYVLTPYPEGSKYFGYYQCVAGGVF